MAAEPPTFNMEAVSATIRYDQRVLRYEHDRDWVTLVSVYQTKRRFQSIPYGVFHTIVELETDHRGHRRFLLHTDVNRTVWVKAVSYQERNLR